MQCAGADAYARRMSEGFKGPLLLLDTCGERASVAVARGDAVVASTVLPERAASAGLLAAVQLVLQEASVGIAELAGVGVVSGPGSFTGVRVGLAMAKGLCVSRALRMAAVSRLEVLADAGDLRDGFAVLNGGRGQLYVREVNEERTREFLVEGAEFAGLVGGREVVYSEPAVAVWTAGASATRMVELSAGASLTAVVRCLEAGGTEVATADANYVRKEEEIYASKRQSDVVS